MTSLEFAGSFVNRSDTMWLSSFTMYGPPAAPRYTGIWVPYPGGKKVAPQSLALSLTAAEAKVVSKTFPGNHPMLIGATGGESDARFSIVLVKANPADLGYPKVFVGESLGHATADIPPNLVLGPPQAKQPTVVSSVAAYNDGGSLGSGATLATIKTFWPSGKPGVLKGGYRPWNLTLFDTIAFDPLTKNESMWEVAQDHKTMRSGWARPEVAIPINFGSKHLTLWRTDTYAAFPADMAAPFDMGIRVVSPIFSELDVCDAITAKWAEGFVPLSIGATQSIKGNGSQSATFAIAFRPINQRRPLPKRLVILRAGATIARPLRVTSDDQIVNVFTPHFVSPTLPPIAPPSGPFEPVIGKWSPSDPVYASLDNIFVTHLREEAIHCAQWAAAKNDNPFAGSAYTWAEEGYPLVTPHSPMPIASCAKALTGLAVVHHFAPNGNTKKLKKSIFQLLNVNVQPMNQLAAAGTTLDDCLYMTTGFDKSLDGNEALAAKWAQPTGQGHLPALPGDQTKFFQNYPQSIWVAQPPGAPWNYDGMGTRLMSELLGMHLAGGTTMYEKAMLDWWQLNSKQAFSRPETVAGCLAVSPPQHDSRPNVTTLYLKNGMAVPGPSCYAGNGNGWGQGSGGWNMSAMTVCRILMAMSPYRISGPKILPAEVQLLAEEADHPGNGRHIIVSNGAVKTQFSFGGAWAGSASGFTYEFDTGMPPGSPTWAVAAMSNQVPYSSIGAILSKIQSMNPSLLPAFTYDQA
ncbi:MAG: serine hydrolase [Polyangiaceae bacterium]